MVLVIRVPVILEGAGLGNGAQEFFLFYGEDTETALRQLPYGGGDERTFAVAEVYVGVVYPVPPLVRVYVQQADKYSGAPLIVDVYGMLARDAWRPVVLPDHDEVLSVEVVDELAVHLRHPCVVKFPVLLGQLYAMGDGRGKQETRDWDAALWFGIPAARRGLVRVGVLIRL